MEQMGPLTENETERIDKERALELFKRAADKLEAFVDLNPDADWVQMGYESTIIYGFGADAEIPSHVDHNQLEAEKGEPIVILGTRPVITGEIYVVELGEEGDY